jgi:hypothetical protein
MGVGASSEVGGFRVHSVASNSPGDEAGLEPFFDYVIKVCDIPILSDSQSFFSMMKAVEGKPTELVVFNSRDQSIRTVSVVPRVWEGIGLLGVMVQYEHITNQNEALHVMAVTEGSPAAFAGLVPDSDYIICTEQSVLTDIDNLHSLLSNNSNLRLLVYNSLSEELRWITLHPGEGGTMGCEIGTGLLHRIPISRHAVVLSTPPELIKATIAEIKTSEPPSLVPFD